MKKLELLLIALLGFSTATAQDKYTLSGYVTDLSNGESLIGATVAIKELGSGNITNVYGFYSITVAPGIYTVSYSYIGYQDISQQLELRENVRLDIGLSPSKQQLEAVVVRAEAKDENISGAEMSTAKLGIAKVKKMPAFMGEVDVIKSIQLLPGVSNVGEGASGFNVRGGSVGQNLILLDEAPVYNSSHLLGFFSVFNPDAVKDVKLYKGGIPANYGGRLSSVLDVRMKEGNNKSYNVAGGIGTIFSRLAIEGPLAKDKASFIIAGRRSYADLLFRPFVKVLRDGARMNFYDLTLKANYAHNAKNRFYVSGYLGRDNFFFDSRQGFSWGNKTGTLRWNHLFNDKLFSNVTLLTSDYDYSLAFGDDDQDLFEWDSKILSYQLKPEFSYFINTSSELTFGANVNFYKFRPADARGVSLGNESDISLQEKQSIESAAYIGLKQGIGSQWTILAGLRFSNFSYLGGADVYTFGDTVAGLKKPVKNIGPSQKGEIIKNHKNLEPRLSLKYQIGPSASIKASYNRTAQYIHLISNTTASNPLDIWTPSTNNIKPQTGDQIALGLFKNLKGNMYESSIEVYYKKNKNQLDYINGADLFFNEELEGEILSGEGTAYGVEFFLKKNSGKLNGWISYTLSRSELDVAGISEKPYPTRYDQLHNLTIVSFYDLSKRWSFSGNFSLISGTPFTSPNGRFEQQGYVAPTVDVRNAGRIPLTHRLDLAATWSMKEAKKNGKPKTIKDHWVFNIYNIYMRKNPFTIYFRQRRERAKPDEPIGTEAVQVSIFASLIPGISYNFKF